MNQKAIKILKSFIVKLFIVNSHYIMVTFIE